MGFAFWGQLLRVIQASNCVQENARSGLNLNCDPCASGASQALLLLPFVFSCCSTTCLYPRSSLIHAACAARAQGSAGGAREQTPPWEAPLLTASHVPTTCTGLGECRGLNCTPKIMTATAPCWVSVICAVGASGRPVQVRGCLSHGCPQAPGLGTTTPPGPSAPAPVLSPCASSAARQLASGAGSGPPAACCRAGLLQPQNSC